MSMTYDLPALTAKALNSRQLAAALEDCAGQMVRFDERLHRADEALQRGLQDRLNFLEAQGMVSLQGHLVHLEDLVLYDLHSLARIPDEDVHLGAAALSLRRWLSKQPRSALLGHEALERMVGNSLEGPGAAEFTEDSMLQSLMDNIDRAMRGEERRGARGLADELAELASLPVMLAAVLLLDYCASGAILAKRDAGFAICGAYLRAKGLVMYHQPALARAASRIRYRHRMDWEPERRLMALTQVVAQAARLAMDDMNRLVLAREAMSARTKALRSGSKLPALIDLFMSHPALSIDAIAAKLRVTPQAVEHMLKKQLAGVAPRPLREQQRYRTFGII